MVEILNFRKFFLNDMIHDVKKNFMLGGGENKYFANLFFILQPMIKITDFKSFFFFF